MNLIKTSILSAISTVIKVIAGFVSTKIVALYIGPSGLALMGQMQNFISMMSSIASAGVNNGVVKYTAEFYNDNSVKQKIWSSALKISVILIVPMGICIILMSKHLSKWLLHTETYSSIFIIFAVTVVFFVLNGLLTSILNGQGEIKKLTLLNITGSLLGLIVTVFLVIKFRLYGALVAGIVSQSIVFFVTLTFVIKSKWCQIHMFIDKLDKEFTIKLLKFSLMALTSAIMVPVSQLYVRDYIASHIGWDQAGYWQAIWKISETYLLIITTTLSVYYLPKLSSIQEKAELRKELWYGYKVIMPTVILLACGIYIFRDLIVSILFAKSFAPMRELFFYQLIGDVIKIASWLLGFILVAKAMTKMFIVTEVIFNLSFIGFSIFFINMYGLIGATIGFMVNYTVYLLVLYFNLRGYIYGK